MRARGAQVTDIAVIVVAADDGVKPQTEEAVDHAKAAGVPMLVAVNKIDKEGADPTRVRTEMTQLGLQPSDWGGDTEFVDVSAKTSDGLDGLLETIQVVADLQELKANPDADASGVVIESKLDPGRGPVVTLLIQRGTLEVGDALVAGAHWGKVRAMHDYAGDEGQGRRARRPGRDPRLRRRPRRRRVLPRGRERPRARAAGRRARPPAEDRDARPPLRPQGLLRGRLQARRRRARPRAPARAQGRRLRLAGGLRGRDRQAARSRRSRSTSSTRASAASPSPTSCSPSASDAVVLGFNVRPVGDAAATADREGVEIRTYSVIYKALDDLRDAMEGMLEPEEVEETVGTVEVRQTFRASRIGTIAGSYVTDGIVRRGAKVRIVRDGTVIYDTTIGSLRALQRGRARGRGRLRVRHRARELPGRQGRRRPRGLRDAEGRARARP